jgi:hypothetical protein
VLFVTPDDRKWSDTDLNFDNETESISTLAKLCTDFSKIDCLAGEE